MRIKRENKSRGVHHSPLIKNFMCVQCSDQSAEFYLVDLLVLYVTNISFFLIEPASNSHKRSAPSVSPLRWSWHIRLHKTRTRPQATTVQTLFQPLLVGSWGIPQPHQIFALLCVLGPPRGVFPTCKMCLENLQKESTHRRHPNQTAG